jgi:hypothetical protein
MLLIEGYIDINPCSFTTGSEFDGWDENNKEKRQGIGLSVDQEINPILGVFARAAG